GGVGADPSGVGALTVAGAAVRPDAAGRFRTTVPLAPGAGGATVAIAVADGAGNRREITRTVTITDGNRVRRPAVRIAGRRVVRGRLVVTLRVARPARLRVELQRPVRTRRGLAFRRVGPAVRTAVPAGVRTVRLTLPRRPGAYRLRVAATAAGGTRVVTATVRVRR
ncbi:MAG TPA: hypothetical protein VNT51_00250, partial [Miltoncostaeaceae bacterium]|nr:hypothetical protein [Miltoncostaeaceae bacterium]